MKQLRHNEAYHLSHWFNKIDEHTIELRERRGGYSKIMLTCFALIILMFAPQLATVIGEKLEFSFVVDTRFEDEWNFVEDRNNLGYTRAGKTKEEFMAGMREMHKGSIKDGYIVLTPMVLFIFYCLRPSKRRFRFDRKRGIIYTYAKGRLYVTEINKLMRPLSEYVVLRYYGVLIWIHPYEQPPSKKKKFFGDSPSLMEFSVFSMWKCALTRDFRDSTTFLMERTIIDFMNPDTDPEYLADMMKAIEKKPDLLSQLFSWVSIGLYCKPLPKKDFLEKQLEDYFENTAPTIKAHPSWYYRFKPFSQVLKEGLYDIIPIEENKRAGFKQVPCPTLFEIPNKSLHDSANGSLEPHRPWRPR